MGWRVWEGGYGEGVAGRVGIGKIEDHKAIN